MNRRWFDLSLIVVILVLNSAVPAKGECPVFPADNIWNVRVDHLPVDVRSDAYIQSIGANTGLHPDFGSGTWDGGPIGIPYNTVPGNQAKVSVTFDYADESDPGPYPIPFNPAIEYGSDHHILIVDRDQCKLYELWDSRQDANGHWSAGSGAIFDLQSNALRPSGWTSADAAGLPILPGLARCEEVTAGAIHHALRFTAARTQQKYVWPARHFASSITDANVPPMGQRFRLKASLDLSRYSSQTRVILTALQTYGMILADNGSNGYISGSPGACWMDDTLVTELRSVTVAAFEAVDVSGLMVNPDSGQARSGDLPAAIALITHYYQSILGRAPDTAGLAYWQELIAQRQAQGEDVKPVFRDMAYFFFNSPEYLNNRTSDHDYIEDLYLTFFQREPDSAGLSFWLNQLAMGVSRNTVIIGFLYSQEFTAFMQTLGF